MISDAEDVILSRFGIPKIEGIKSEDLILITNAENINGTKEKGYHCKDGSFKFCLAKQVDNNIVPILTMEFYKALGSRMLTLLNEKPYIRLNLLFVHADIVFVNINLSQSDHFKSEPLHSELFPNMGEDWEFRVSCPSGQDILNSSRAWPTGRFRPFVSYFV